MRYVALEILMISPTIAPYSHLPGIIGGMETYVNNLTMQLVKNGNYVTLFTKLNHNIDKDFLNGHLRIIGLKTLGLLSYPKIISLLKNRYDIVHSHQLFTSSSILGCLGANILKTPSVLTDHGGGSKTMAALQNILPRAPKIFATVSKYSSCCISRLYKKARCFEVYGGVDLTSFNPKKDVEWLRKKLDVEGYNVLLCVSRLLPSKGVDIMIKALEYLPKRTKLIIVGRCTDQNYFNYLKKLANHRNNQQVIFTDQVSDNQLPFFYNICDVFIMPSVHIDYIGRYHRLPELLGLSKLEAMACGKPVVVSNVGGLPEYVFNRENGFVVKEGDVRQLACAIYNILVDTNLSEKMGQAGLSIIKNNFTWEAVTKRVMKTYKLASME